jgi:hypothetical protein
MGELHPGALAGAIVLPRPQIFGTGCTAWPAPVSRLGHQPVSGGDVPAVDRFPALRTIVHSAMLVTVSATELFKGGPSVARAISGGLAVANDLLRSTRERLGMSRAAAAARVREVLHPDPRQRSRSPFNANYLGKLERGQIRWVTKPEYRAALRIVMQVDTDAELGFFDPDSAGTLDPQGVDGSPPTTPAGRPEGLGWSRLLRDRDTLDSGSAAREILGDATLQETQVQPPTDGVDVLRRSLGKAIAGYAVHRTLSRVVPQTAPREPDLVEEWREAAMEYGYSYLTRPRRELIADLNEDIAIILRILEGPLDTIDGQGLSGAAARILGLSAMACTDLGFAREARHLWRRAREASDRSEEPDSQLWVRGHEITLGIYEGRPLPILLSLAEQGLARGSGRKTAGYAELLGGKAEALALLKRESEAVATLHQMEDAFADLPSPITGQVDNIYGWPEYRLLHAQSFVYTSLGLTSKAYEAQQAALVTYPSSRAISRSQIEMHHAECLVRDKHLSDGLNHAIRTLRSVPGPKRHKFVTRVASKVWECIPGRERCRPEAMELRQEIVAAELASSAGAYR